MTEFIIRTCLNYDPSVPGTREKTDSNSVTVPGMVEPLRDMLNRYVRGS